MKKHWLNTLPDARDEQFQEIVTDIRENGFDKRQPITVYEGDILDGWQRQRACDLLKVNPQYVTFSGSHDDALAFVIRMARRRDMNSGQRAMFADECEQAREKLAAAAKKRMKSGKPDMWPCHHCGGEHPTGGLNPCHPSQKIDEGNSRRTDHKLAEMFNTNRTYVNEARKIREASPAIAEKVKAGAMTLQDAKRAVRAIPTTPWLPDEKERKAKVEAGKAVIANAERDKNLIQWAESRGLVVMIDRTSPYGNPFILGKDGDRETVCNSYRNHYLPHKPSIKKSELKGKVLVCHCYPERCHGEHLI